MVSVLACGNKWIQVGTYSSNRQFEQAVLLRYTRTEQTRHSVTLNDKSAPDFDPVMTIITLHHFSLGAALPQKNTSSVQNNPLRFHTMSSKKMVRSYYCLNSVFLIPNNLRYVSIVSNLGKKKTPFLA